MPRKASKDTFFEKEDVLFVVKSGDDAIVYHIEKNDVVGTRYRNQAVQEIAYTLGLGHLKTHGREDVQVDLAINMARVRAITPQSPTIDAEGITPTVFNELDGIEDLDVRMLNNKLPVGKDLGNILFEPVNGKAILLLTPASKHIIDKLHGMYLERESKAPTRGGGPTGGGASGGHGRLHAPEFR